MSIEEIREYLERYGRVEADTELLGAGLIDSMALYELVAWLEEKERVTIPASALVRDNFETPRRIAGFIEQLKHR